MKKTPVLLMLVSLSFALIAQEETETPWKNGGQVSVNFSQTALSNWAGGGENALALNGFLSYFANYHMEKFSWDNTFDIAYGMLNQGGTVQKTDDKFELTSKFGYLCSGSWNYSGLVSFKTQMAKGYENDTTLISSFAAPAYLQAGFGMEYKPNDDFSVIISPLGGKITLVLNQDLSAQGVYGVDAGEKVRAEFGAYAKAQYRKEIFENVVFQTKFDMFMNYIEKPLSVDFNWDVLLAMKINKFLTANISTQMAYDRDYNNKLQFKETLGIGISFSL